MDLSDIKDIASIMFFSLGALAVVIGAPLALKRLVLEQPYAPCWETVLGDCTVRQIQEGTNKGSYSYSVEVRVTNRSRSVQKLVRIWNMASLPAEGDLTFRSVPYSNVKEVEEVFNDPGREIDREISPDQSFWFATILWHKTLDHLVNLNYCFETRSRRLLWVGYEQTPRFNFGSSMVPAPLEEIRFYENDTKTTDPPSTPPAPTS